MPHDVARAYLLEAPALDATARAASQRAAAIYHRADRLWNRGQREFGAVRNATELELRSLAPDLAPLALDQISLTERVHYAVLAAEQEAMAGYEIRRSDAVVALVLSDDVRRVPSGGRAVALNTWTSGQASTLAASPFRPCRASMQDDHRPVSIGEADGRSTPGRCTANQLKIPVEEGALTMRALLADRRVRLFYLGGTLAMLGDNVLWLAMTIWVKLLTGSTSLAGVTVLMLVVGNMAAPLTGMLADRVRRRPLMIWTFLATALLLLSLLTVRDSHGVWLIYIVTFFYGISGSITMTASAALRPLIVDEEKLVDANGLLQAINQTLRIITPLIGVGLLAQLGAAAMIIADAVIFVLAAACLVRLRLDEGRPEPSENSWLRDVGAGVAFIARKPILGQLAVAFAIAMLGVGMFETVGLQVVTVGLGHAPTWVGVLAAVQGSSGVIAGLTAAPIARRLGDRTLAIVGLAITGALTIALAVPSDAVVIASTAVLGIGVPWAFVAQITIFQKATPNAVMGRVMGAQGLSAQVPQSIGIAVGAALVAVVDYRLLCYTIAALIVLAALFLVARRPSLEPGPADRPDPELGTAADLAVARTA
jgi:MFS family permease